MFGKLFKSKKEQVKLFYNTDVHCHILPGVDHGSQSVEQSLEMLKAEAEMGIHRVILTSHVTAVTFENTRETLMDAFMKLKDAVADAGIDMELYLSAEYRMDEYFDKEYAADHLIPMPGNHILLENSFQQELMNLDDLLFDMQVKGYRRPAHRVGALPRHLPDAVTQEPKRQGVVLHLPVGRGAVRRAVAHGVVIARERFHRCADDRHLPAAVQLHQPAGVPCRAPWTQCCHPTC